MIFDTDVLIWVLRGNARAANAMDQCGQRAISVVTYMELLRGARDKREIKAIKTLLADLQLHVLPLTENIGHRASIYMEEYALSGGMDIADAFVAATVIENKGLLLSGNAKHYRQINEMNLSVFRP
jgi:predicted nucleic acid-binding protein